MVTKSKLLKNLKKPEYMLEKKNVRQPVCKVSTRYDHFLTPKGMFVFPIVSNDDVLPSNAIFRVVAHLQEN